MRECDIAAEISYWHRKYGAECDAFDPIVASGERSALPHARASDKIIRRGEMVVLDFGCRYRGYHSDLTRTIAVGKPSAEMKKVYQIVFDAQMKAIDAAHAAVFQLGRSMQLRGNTSGNVVMEDILFTRLAMDSVFMSTSPCGFLHSAQQYLKQVMW